MVGTVQKWIQQHFVDWKQSISNQIPLKIIKSVPNQSQIKYK